MAYPVTIKVKILGGKKPYVTVDTYSLRDSGYVYRDGQQLTDGHQPVLLAADLSDESFRDWCVAFARDGHPTNSTTYLVSVV